jgi:predicted site-specific integrase-resolvase
MLIRMPKQSPFIGSAEACTILGIHPATLMRWVRDGKVEEAHKLPGDNGARLFMREDIEQLAAERAEQSA